MRTAAISLLATAATLWSGCGETMRDSRNRFAAKSGQSDSAFARFDVQSPIAAGALHSSEGEFLPAAAFADNGAKELPPRLQKPGSVQIRSRDPMTLRQILERLADMTGIPHAAYYGPESSPENSASVGPAVNGSEGKRVMRPNLRGSLPEILDEVARHFEFDWKFAGERVELNEFAVRTYLLATLPTATRHSSNIGSATSSASIDLTSEIKSTLESLAGPESIVNFGGGTGLITIVARESRHGRIARYIEGLNKSLSRQIAFDVTVLTVSLARSENYGLDLGLAIDQGGDSFAWSGSRGASGGSGTVNIGIARDGFKLEAMVDALNKIGDVAIETRSGTTVSNNGIAPVQVVREISFAEKIETVKDSGGNVQTSIAPGKLVTGFEMQLLPRILNSRELLVKFTVRISDLNRIAEFTSDRQSIQLPEVSTVSFEQQAILRNGHTLVLAGFERERTMLSNSGFLGTGLSILGGRTGAEKERVATVLTIRPRILQGGTSHHSGSISASGTGNYSELEQVRQ
ncbi:MAG: hypothetical protein OXN84_01835 [Albidovulum sp.]|nr:hypothetical protein [Albidovulum sp.]